MTLPKPGEERVFGLRDIVTAVEWANAGGIAIQRSPNLDGEVIGGRRRFGPAFRVYGHEATLRRWGRKHHLQPEWMQEAGRNRPPYFHVFGARAWHVDRAAP